MPITFFPRLAPAVQATGGAQFTYGNLVELEADGDAFDKWVTGLQMVLPDTANTDYFVALSREAAGGAPTKIEARGATHSQTTVQADHNEVVRFDPPVYFPAGTGIRFACADSNAAGGKKISAWAIVSKGRG
jgi:hypothetical protein